MKQLILAGILIVQLLFAVLLWYLNTPREEAQEAFLSFDVDAVSEVTVRGDGEEIVLRKPDEEWVLPSDHPADGDKVVRVLEKLATADTGWPVATSESTAKRFEVTEENYQKHIVVQEGEETVADVYFGTSPGFRKTHVRKAEGGPVYAIEFSNYEAGTDANSWLDKYLLRPRGTVQSVTRVDGYTLTQSDEGWKTDSDAEIDESKVRSFIDRFETLTVFEISDAELSETAPTVQFDITDDQGAMQLQLFHIEDGDKWIARSDRFEGKFGVAKYIASELDKQLSDLVVDDEETEESAESETVKLDITPIEDDAPTSDSGND